MTARLFEPLGMTDSFFDVPAEAVGRFGTDHYVNNGQVIVQDNPREDPEFIGVTFLSGGGGLVMTAEDYLRFALMMINGGSLEGARVLSPTTVQLMTTNLLPAESTVDGAGFGLGFAVTMPGPSQDTRTPGSYSWGGAAGTFFWIDPTMELVAVFMPQRIGAPRLDSEDSGEHGLCGHRGDLGHTHQKVVTPSRTIHFGDQPPVITVYTDEAIDGSVSADHCLRRRPVRACQHRAR